MLHPSGQSRGLSSNWSFANAIIIVATLHYNFVLGDRLDHLSQSLFLIVIPAFGVLMCLLGGIPARIRAIMWRCIYQIFSDTETYLPLGSASKERDDLERALRKLSGPNRVSMTSAPTSVRRLSRVTCDWFTDP